MMVVAKYLQTPENLANLSNVDPRFLGISKILMNKPPVVF